MSATELQNYYNSGIGILRSRYVDRLNTNWVPALRNVGSAFERAHERMDRTLREAEKAATARRDFYFSVLSLAMGAQLRWIGFWAAGTQRAQALSENVRGYFVGGLEDGAKFLAEQGITGVRDSIDTSLPSLNVGPSEFGNTLLNTFDTKRGEVTGKLNDIAVRVHRQSGWAEQLLSHCGGDVERAKATIRGWERRLEQDWLMGCYYYRHSPNGLDNVEDMARALERTMWAVWVQGNIRVRTYTPTPGYHNDYDSTPRTTFTNPEEVTLTRLEHLRVIAPADAGERRSIREQIENDGGTWRDGHRAPVPNFGWVDDLADVRRLRAWARDHRTESLGNLPPGNVPPVNRER